MDVILIQPRERPSSNPRRLASRPTLPLSLLTIATPLDVAGYQVRIIDQRTDIKWEESLLAELKTKPICVGVTSMTGTQLWWGLKASEIVKRSSNVPVVWGGVHPTLLPQQTLENTYVDIVVQGEGEETFFELVRAMANKQPLAQIKGIWYKDGGQIKQTSQRPFVDLNRQPPLSYHLIDLTNYRMNIVGRDAILFETSRGCPFRCAFCYNSCFNRRQWRSLTVEQVLLRIKRLVDEYGVRGIAFSDDNFFINLDRSSQILEGMLQQKFNIVWGQRDMRLDVLSRVGNDFLQLIERSGCLSLIIGIESGSQRIVDLLRKPINISQAVAVNQRLARYKMQLQYLFLIGIPGETEDDLAQTASLMLRLMDDNQKAREGINIFTPYPGTELFDLSVQYGLSVPRKLEEWIPFSWSDRRLDYPWLSPQRKRLLQMMSFCGLLLAKYKKPQNFSDVWLFVSLVARLYSPIARRRIAGLHYHFFPELKIAELLGFRGY